MALGQPAVIDSGQKHALTAVFLFFSLSSFLGSASERFFFFSLNI